MSLKLFFADHEALNHFDWAKSATAGRSSRVPEGCPIILHENFKPAQPWSEFLRLYAQSVSKNTIQAYGRDLFKFADFLNKRNISLVNVKDDDLVEFRNHRLSSGLSSRSWTREVVVMRAFFNYLLNTGVISRKPWVEIGRYSVIKPKTTTFDLNVRALTQSQWNRFKNVGLGGLLEDGEISTDFSGRNSNRNKTAAEFALTTGLRLQEWSTILCPEIIEIPDGGATVELEIAAKGKIRRTVYVPHRTVSEIAFYRQTERRRIVRHAQKSLEKNYDKLAHVESMELINNRISYSYLGTKYNLPLRQVPLQHRRLLVFSEGLIEPLSLFIGANGKPPSSRSWHQVFQEANRRIRCGSSDDLFSFHGSITPHDLRHTFAVVLLQSLQRRAFHHEYENRGEVGRGSLSEHIIFNPLLTLQRLLGHASPKSTMMYLRFVEDSDRLIQHAFDEWDDPLRDYSDYVLARLSDEERPRDE